MKAQGLAWLIRLALGGLFIWAGATKILEPGLFARSMAAYELLPDRLILPLAYVLPWLEVLCGAALIVRRFDKGAVVWANLLILVFLVALGINLGRGVDVDCGCFGPEGGGGTWAAFKRDLLFLPLALAGLWAVFRRRPRHRQPGRSGLGRT